MSDLTVVTSVREMQEIAESARAHGKLGLVPTMGALHEGHLSLVQAAKEACETVVVSLFVNPTQFGPGEDFQRYPRTFERDLALLAQEDVSYVFAPSAEEIYPSGTSTVIDVGVIGERLDGKFRPGHFRGVATIVAKLFHITLPHLAFFGQKDAAQVAVLRTMVRDLNFAASLVVCPTVRESDGLAMSSRNRYLSPDERKEALVLHRALLAAEAAAVGGLSSSAALRDTMLKVLASADQVLVEYAEIVSPETLLPVSDVSEGALMAVAAKLGQTRLIDNLLFQLRVKSAAA